MTDFNDKTVAGANALSVNVTSDTTWVWQSSDATWLNSAEAPTQSNDQTFTYEVAENTTGANRTATLTFTSEAGDVSAVLEVTQLSGAGLTLNLSETARVTGAAANATLTVDVSSNTDWLWSSDSDWLTSADAQEQNGDVTFGYEVSANDTGAQRSGTLTFTSATGGLIATLDVTQLSVSGSSLSISETLQTFSYQATTRTVEVISSTEWTWRSSVDWLTSTVPPTKTGSLIGTDAFEYKVAENTHEGPREGELVFTTTNGDIEVRLKVIQLGNSGSFLALEDSNHVNSYVGQERTVQVFSNTDWLWEVQADAAWLTPVGESLQQSGDQAFTYKVEENTTGATRTATITFTATISDQGNIITETLTVTQLSGSASILTLSETELTTSSAGKGLNVEVFSNSDWTYVSDSTSWLTSSEDVGQTGNREDDPPNTPFAFTVSINNTGVSRTGTITFTTTSGGVGVTAILTVTQLSGLGTEFLTVSKTEQDVAADDEVVELEVDVDSNTTWNWQSSDPSWLTSTENNPQNGKRLEAVNPPGAFTYQVSPNTGAEERSATLTFTTASGSITRVLTVTQDGALDTDGDGDPDITDPDDDGDGLTDVFELAYTGSARFPGTPEPILKTLIPMVTAFLISSRWSMELILWIPMIQTQVMGLMIPQTTTIRNLSMSRT